MLFSWSSRPQQNTKAHTKIIFFPKVFYSAYECFWVISQTTLMLRGEIGKLPTGVDILAVH